MVKKDLMLLIEWPNSVINNCITWIPAINVSAVLFQQKAFNFVWRVSQFSFQKNFLPIENCNSAKTVFQYNMDIVVNSCEYRQDCDTKCKILQHF